MKVKRLILLFLGLGSLFFLPAHAEGTFDSNYEGRYFYLGIYNKEFSSLSSLSVGAFYQYTVNNPWLGIGYRKSLSSYVGIAGEVGYVSSGGMDVDGTKNGWYLLPISGRLLLDTTGLVLFIGDRLRFISNIWAKIFGSSDNYEKKDEGKIKDRFYIGGETSYSATNLSPKEINLSGMIYGFLAGWELYEPNTKNSVCLSGEIGMNSGSVHQVSESAFYLRVGLKI